MIHQKEPVITIDGASGTGKGTVGFLLAKRLGFKFLDSGVLYRVLALAARKHGFVFDNTIDANADKAAASLVVLAEHLDVQFIALDEEPPRIILEGEDVTEEIRTERVGNDASKVASLPSVRAALLSRQRAFRDKPGLVADGRDMGTIVFPDAVLKVFLTASLDVRALRRYNQLKDRGINVTLADLIEELEERDRRDQERSVAPLKPAEDAICIDTDRLTIDQVVDKILYEIEGKKAFPVIPEINFELASVGITE